MLFFNKSPVSVLNKIPVSLVLIALLVTFFFATGQLP